ncbi:MAG: hypothetical protein ACJ77Z_05435 [Thermoleophilaceae bacterium]|jgi:hypothetical protein
MRAPAFFAFTLLAVALAGCGPMDRPELKREVQSIRSLATEGAFLASDVAADRTKVTFVRVHAREMGDAAEHSAEKIQDSEVPEEIGFARNRAIKIAMDLSDDLGQLEVFPGNEGKAAQVRTSLRQEAANAEKLVQDLNR